MKEKETWSHGKQAIIKQGKRHAHGMCWCCGHDGEKKAFIILKGMYTWHVHVRWHSNCVKQAFTTQKACIIAPRKYLGMYNARDKAG